MSLARLDTPSAIIMSTSRRIGRWLACSALTPRVFPSSSICSTSKSLPMPSSSRETTVSVSAIELVELLPDLRWRRQQHPHLAPGREGQHLLGVDVERVGGGDLEVGVGLPDGNHVEPPGQLLRNASRSAWGRAWRCPQRETETGWRWRRGSARRWPASAAPSFPRATRPGPPPRAEP